MSDDDCDIFNLPLQQKAAVPQRQFMPDQESSQTDYDFIKSNHAAKKPAKVAKDKQTAPTKSKNRRKKKDDKEFNSNVLEGADASPEAAQAPTTRALSPVSQLIYEMEQKQIKAKANEIEKLPIARRTRSSLGKSQKKNEQEEIAPVEPAMSPTKKRNVRGRRSTAAARAQRTESVNITEPKRNRRHVAELAARSHVVDSIDLVSAVMPRVEGFVNLDSDDEENETLMAALAGESASAAYNFDDENPIVEINLNWLGEMQSYKLRQHQKFSHMFKEVAKRNGVPKEDIVINMDDHFISPTESPQTVGLKVYHILSGCAMKSNKATSEGNPDANLMLKPKKFQLKVQGDRWKQPLIIPIKRTETFKILYIKCAEEMECNVNDFKLFFDGELLEPDDTPKNQEMEGNEMIDFRSK